MTTLPLRAPIVNTIAPANPRDSWPAWTDEDTWELGPDLHDEPRPTAGPDFEPGPGDEAERLGYVLGVDREEAAPPASLAPAVARRFFAGLMAGSREWASRLDEMFADAVADGRVTDFDVHPRGVC